MKFCAPSAMAGHSPWLRPIDVFGRLGGEGFGILLPETDGQEGVVAAERLRQAIADHPIPLQGGTALKVTASFGVAALSPAFGSVPEWIEAADKMLYVSKAAGRNCTRLAELL